MHLCLSVYQKCTMQKTIEHEIDTIVFESTKKSILSRLLEHRFQLTIKVKFIILIQKTNSTEINRSKKRDLQLIPGIGNSEGAVLLNDLIKAFRNRRSLLRRHPRVYLPEIHCTFSWEMTNHLCLYSSSYSSYSCSTSKPPHRHFMIAFAASLSPLCSVCVCVCRRLLWVLGWASALEFKCFFYPNQFICTRILENTTKKLVLF